VDAAVAGWQASAPRLVNRSLQNGTIRVGDEVQVKGGTEENKIRLTGLKLKSISRKV